MNALLCRELGHHGQGFPTAAQVIAAADGLQERCKLGYRTGWVVDLARKFCAGEIDHEWFESPDATPEELRKAITSYKVRKCNTMMMMMVVVTCSDGGGDAWRWRWRLHGW